MAVKNKVLAQYDDMTEIEAVGNKMLTQYDDMKYQQNAKYCVMRNFRVFFLA